MLGFRASANRSFPRILWLEIVAGLIREIHGDWAYHRGRIPKAFIDAVVDTRYIAILLGLVVVAALADGVQIYLMNRTAEAAVRRTRYHLIGRMLRLPIPSYGRLQIGDLVTRLGSDTTLVRQAFSGGLVDAAAGLVTIIGAAVMMALIDIWMLAIVLGVVAFASMVVVIVSSAVQSYTTKVQESVGTLGAGMDRALGAIRTIRASRAESRVEADLRADADTAFDHGVKIARIEGLLWPATDISMQLSFLLVLGVGGLRVAGGTLSVADLVTFVLYMFMLAMPIGLLFSAATSIRQAMGALVRIGDVLAEDEEDPSGGIHTSGTSLTFDNVCFSYDGVSPTLHDVSFHVPAGSRTAIVGPSGSGKSTTLALLGRFYDVDSGRILLGESDISVVARSEVRTVVGMVEQEAAVLAGNVRDNLTLANPEATDEECLQALEKVNLRSRFTSLDDELSERGVSLSGGQRQRLALARMLLMQSPVLLLDEPTSAVDSRNERIVLDAIGEKARNRTAIIVAHRLSTIIDADQIVVMNQGRVEATGTHSELLQSCELYRDLASKQLLT